MGLKSLLGDKWGAQTARAGFPILVEYAKRNEPITYKQWDQEISNRGLGKSKRPFYVVYRYPAGQIGDACAELSKQIGERIPPINLLVVNGATNFPGDGADPYIEEFYREFLGKNKSPSELSKREKLAIIRRAHEEISQYRNWDEVLTKFELKATVWKKPLRKPIAPPNPKGWATGPESKEHKDLKLKIAQNPGLVGLPRSARGEPEFELWSGDRIDVYFPSQSQGIEVKTSRSVDELHRGIFQCIKYRAVLQAQQIQQGLAPTAGCSLAIGGKLPERIAELAKLFRIPCFDQLTS